MLLKGLFFALLVLGIQCQLQNSLHQSINNMIGGAVGVDHLVTFTAVHGQHHPINTDSNRVSGYFSQTVNLPHVGWNVQPFAKFRPLVFGTNTKVNALTYHTQISASGSGFIVSNAILGVRSGTTAQMISAYGVVMVQGKQQFNVQTERKCKTVMLVKKCHDEEVKVPRGFFTHEIEAIIKEAQRRAAVAMRQSLGLGSEANAPTALNSAFHDEHNRLRSLYPEIQYDYEDFQNINMSDWNNVLIAGMSSQGDQSGRDRVNSLLNSVSHSNFIWAVNANHLYYLIVHKNGNGTFNLHVSHFIVGGSSKLPSGAFATSTGSWSIEQAGAGANPSLHQVLAIFRYQ